MNKPKVRTASTGLMTIAMLSTIGLDTEFFPKYNVRIPKNKFNLTPEQLDQMSAITPKQKKRFLKKL